MEIIKSSKYHPNLFQDRPYQMCTKTVMDTTDPDIIFDDLGISNHYYQYQNAAENILLNEPKRTEKLNQFLSQIKTEGKGKKYDCLIGLSGGVDSTYVAYLVKQFGLNPLAVHFDNGWNSELAVHNINSIIENLDIDLHTIVVNWEEFRDLQLAYLRASVIDIEVVSDHAIQATMLRLAKKFNIDYVISGTNVVTEYILPNSWIFSKLDYTNLSNIHKKFGSKKLATYPHISFSRFIYYSAVKKLTPFPILDYIDYDKKNTIDIIQNKLDWRDYGGKHCESLWTKFYQNYILPQKFGVDKRKAHLSTLICSNQITREVALSELRTPIYDEMQLREDKSYVIKKLGITSEEFEKIMHLTPVPHENYGTDKLLKRNYFAFLEKTSSFRKLLK